MRTYSVVKTESADSKAFIWNIKNYSLRRWKVKQPNFFNLSYKNLMSSSWPVRANLFIICFIGYGNSRFNRQFQGHRLWNASFYSIHLFLFLSIRPRLSRKDENTLHKYVRANTLSWYRRYLKSSDLTITFYFPYLVLNLKDGLYHSYCSRLSSWTSMQECRHISLSERYQNVCDRSQRTPLSFLFNSLPDGLW